MPLPEVTRTVTVQPTGVVRSSGAASRLFGELAVEADRFRDKLRADQEAAQAAYLANLTLDHRVKAAQLAAEHQFEPDAFQAVAAGTIEGALESLDPDVRQAAEPRLRNAYATAYINILNQTAARDRTLQDDALQAASETFRDDMLRAAETGDMAAFEQARNDYGLSLTGRARGGFISEERAMQTLEAADDEARAATYLGFVKNTYAERGMAGAWREIDEFAADPALPPAVAKRFTNTAQEWVREQVTFSNAMEAQAERAVREREEATARQAWEMVADGRMSRDWLDNNRDSLSVTEYKSLLKTLSGDDAIDNPEVENEILRDIYSGGDATGDILRAHNNGQIKGSTARTLLNTNRELQRTEGPKSEFERSRKFIVDSLDPGEFVNDPAGRSRTAQALRMYDDFAQQDPPPTDTELRDFADQTVERFQIVDWSETAALLPLPRFFVGTRTDPNLQATESAIMQALDNGQISAEQARQEALIVDRWRRALAARNRNRTGE